MELPVGDVNEARDVAAQVDQRVQLDRRLGRAKWRPGEQRKAQIDGGGIERVDGFLEVDPEGLVDVEPARDPDQVLRELRINAPVAPLVRVGQRAARHRSPNTQVVELGGLCPKAGGDVAQALAIGELRESHAAELIRATEIADTMIAAVALDDATEALPRNMIHQLGEHQLADVHAHRLCLRRRQIRAIQRSNRRHPRNGSLPPPINSLQNSDHTLTGQ